MATTLPETPVGRFQAGVRMADQIPMTSTDRAAVVTLVAAVFAVFAFTNAAQAESADAAKARAEAAAAEVSQLQAEVDDARSRYQSALDGLAGVVQRVIDTDAHAQKAAEQAAAAAQERVQALRSLSQSGGSLAVLDTVFTAETPGDLAARWQLSQQVLDLLSDRSANAHETSDFSDQRAAQAQADADRQIGTVSQVEDAYRELQDLLDQQQEILDSLDTRARKLATAERAAARVAAERAAAAAAATTGATTATAGGIPKNFVRLYQAAAGTCRGLPWPVLAAIGQVESGHGTNNGPSSSGAEGPMQFLPSTFAAYAVDGDKDGDRDIWDPADAIFSAAHYLCANGAGGGPRALYGAIYRYNHADWYVLLVMNVAGQIAKRFDQPVPVTERP